MSSRQSSIFILVFITCSLGAPGVLGTKSANAACGDWLFGRSTSSYAAGYAPYQSGFAPPAGNVYQLRSWDNPSVYTGRPVVQTGALAPAGNTAFRAPVATLPPGPVNLPPAFVQPAQPWGGNNQNWNGSPSWDQRLRSNTGGEVPLAGVLRGNTTSNPFYGTGNIYPNNFGDQYSAARINQLPVTPPPGVAQAGRYPVNSQPPVVGLARFFGSLWGTNYRSNYARAPITYYRPVTTVDPVSGQPVVVQQPCSSYVQQLRRTPYNSFQVGDATVTPIGPMTPAGPSFSAGGPSCASGSCQAYANTAPSTFGQQPQWNQAPSSVDESFGRSFGQSFDQSFGAADPINRVGGITSQSDRNSVSPIPSTAPNGSFYQRNTAPLTGQPSDRDRVPQPQLRSARPSIDGYRDGLYRDDVAPFAKEDPSVIESRNKPAIVPDPIEPKAVVPELPESNWVPRGEAKTAIDAMQLNAPVDPEPTTRFAPIAPSEPDDFNDTTPLLPPPGVTRVPSQPSQPSRPTQVFSDLPPIAAPESDRSPFPVRADRGGPDTRLQAPEYLERKSPLWDDANSASHRAPQSNRVSVPVREATQQMRTSGNRVESQPTQPRTKAFQKAIKQSSGWLPL